jgi:hypothetical protein
MSGHRNWRRRLTSVACTAALLGGWLAGPAVGQAAAASPPPVIAGALALACGSPTSCWEIGPGLRWADLVHGTGSHRSTVVAPKLPGSAAHGGTRLDGITCVSARDCWAVGATGRTVSDSLNYAVHWDGKTWRLAAIPTVDPLHHRSALHGVSCAAAGDCWAVGQIEDGQGKETPQSLHWDGKTWRSSTVVNPLAKSGGTAFLNAVSCTPGGCWAAGVSQPADGAWSESRFVLMHRVAGRWVAVPVPPSPVMFEPTVTCVGPADCWALGAAGDDPAKETLNWAVHWNGHRWSKVAIPSPSGTGSFTYSGNILASNNIPRAISCASTADCWMVGDLLGGSTGGRSGAETLHWNGRRWSAVPAPTHAGDQVDELLGVACLPGHACVVAGTRWDAGWHRHLVTASWNGKRWVS